MLIKVTKVKEDHFWYSGQVGDVFDVENDPDKKGWYRVKDNHNAFILMDDCILYNVEDPLEVQIGGTHYKDFAIQPVEYIMANGLNFLQGCIIKRTTRYNQEGGKGIEDLEKIKHECDLLINFIRGVE